MLLLGACGGSAAEPGDAGRGRQLYHGEIAFANDAPACNTCHGAEPGVETGIGPNLSNIGNRAATTIQDMSVDDYLRQSIVEPDAYLAGGYQEGIHHRGYKNDLTAQQVNDLIAYMRTLKSGQDK